MIEPALVIDYSKLDETARNVNAMQEAFRAQVTEHITRLQGYLNPIKAKTGRRPRKASAKPPASQPPKGK